MKKVKMTLFVSGMEMLALSTLAAFQNHLSVGSMAAFGVCAIAVILLTPSLYLNLSFVALSIILQYLLPFEIVPVLPGVALLILTVDVFLKVRRRFSSVRTLFQNEAVLSSLGESSNLLSVLLLSDVSVLLILSCSVGSRYGEIASALIVMALSIMILIRYVSERTLIMKREKQEELLTLARGCLRPHEFDPGTEDKKMTALYKRVLSYMEDKKPYLEEDISLEQFARHVYSNKTYLSKTINVMSGHNFRQFINYYRVVYAAALLKENPGLKMEDVSALSGFHNVVSFNMAFRLFMSDTPSEWARTNRIRK